MKSNEEDIQLSRGYAKGEPKFIKKFYERYQKGIFRKAYSYLRNCEDAKQLEQDIFTKIYKELQDPNKCKEIRNLDSWVFTVAKNCCKNELKKEKKRILRINHHGIDNEPVPVAIEAIKDNKYIPPGYKKYYDQLKYDERGREIAREYNAMPDIIQEGIERSLDLIEIFYIMIKKIKIDYVKYERAIRIDKILRKTKQEIRYVIGSIPNTKIESYYSLKLKPTNLLTDSEKEELDKLKKQDISTGIHKTLNEMSAIIEGLTGSKILQDLISPVKNKLYNSDFFKYVLCDYAINLSKMSIKPPRLIFAVWAKALRKGKYKDPNKLKNAFLYFTRRTKGTGKEFLFNSIDEELSTYETLRKSLHKKSRHREAFLKLADFIYKASFRPDQLDIFPGEWIKTP